MRSVLYESAERPERLPGPKQKQSSMQACLIPCLDREQCARVVTEPTKRSQLGVGRRRRETSERKRRVLCRCICTRQD